MFKLGFVSCLSFNLFLFQLAIVNAAPPTIGGCQVFPSDNQWNIDISQAPVHPNSANYISNISSSSHVHPDFGSGTWNGAPIGIPFITVTNAQPGVGINFTAYGDESDPAPYPIPLNAPIEGGSSSSGDRHVIAVNTDTCKLYELYRAFPQSTWWDADAGAKWDFSSNATRTIGWTSADAAGLPIFPGLARYQEVAGGQINHALRFTAYPTQKAYVYPATHYASSNTDPNLPPMGLRVRLKSNYDISGFTGQSLVVATALKKYGMILADNGSDWYISGEPNNSWDNNNLNQLKTIPGSAFEVVETAPYSTTDSFTTITNGYKNPSDYVNLIPGDYNGDGKEDLVRQEKNGWDADSVGTFTTLFSVGDGTFTYVPLANAESYKGSYTILTPGDFNGDGKTDLLRREMNGWDNDTANTAHILFSNGDGTFNRVLINNADGLKGTYTNVFVADFNNDGKDDILRQEKNGWDADNANTAQLLISNGDGSFVWNNIPNSASLKGSYTNLFVGDFNNDGFKDILRQEKNGWDADANFTTQIIFYTGGTNFTYSSVTNADSMKGSYTNLYIGDFNNDGKDDILRQEKNGWDSDALYTAQLLTSTGGGNFTVTNVNNSNILKGSFTNLYVGDFNNDGKDDFLRQEKYNWDSDNYGTAQIFTSTGTNFNKAEINNSYKLKDSTQKVTVLDVSGNGAADILRQAKNNYDVNSYGTTSVIIN